MNRLLFCSLAIASLVGGEVLTDRTSAQQYVAPAKRGEGKEFIEKFRKTFFEPVRIRESKPVTVKAAQFVVVAQTQWIPPKLNPSFPVVAPLDIQLRITNLSKSAVIFPTSHTFGLKLISADGKEVKRRAGRKGTTVTRPVLLPGGASYSFWRRAELRWDKKGKASELVYYDGTGSQAILGPLAPGWYKMAFWYAIPPGKRGEDKVGNVAIWVGEVVTEEVLIEVVDGVIWGPPDSLAERSFPKVANQTPKTVNEALRVRESKPVTVKGARFVVVAESDWKPGKTNVPIDIQLHITNLSKNDLIFHTFDTFGLSVINTEGKRIIAGGGRDLAIFTRPILITKGASYALCRKAELRWNARGKPSELYYWDGTGTIAVYGPLHPGRHKLELYYSVSLTPPLKGLLRSERIVGDPSTWLGAAITDQILIEVLDR